MNMQTGGIQYEKLTLPSGKTIQYPSTVNGMNIGVVAEAADLKLKDQLIDPITTKISDNAARLKQMKDLNTYLGSVYKTAESLGRKASTTPPPGGDAYGHKAITMTTNAATVNATDLITPVWASDAPMAPMKIKVNRLATQATIIADFPPRSILSTVSFATTATILSTNPEMLEINGQIINTAASYTLQDLIDNINLEQGTTGVTASAADDGNGGYVLKLTTESNGAPIIVQTIDPNSMLASMGLTSTREDKSFDDTSTQTLTDFGIVDDEVLKLVGSNGTSVITLKSTWTLSELISNINDATLDSGITASFLEVDSSHFLLQLNDITTGTNITFDDTDDAILTKLGLSATSGSNTAEIEISADGTNWITLNSTTNSFDLDAVGDKTERTITVKKADPTVTIDLSVRNTMDAVADELEVFKDAFNLAVAAVLSQKHPPANIAPEEKPVLAGDATFQGIDTLLKNMMDTSVSSNPHGYKRLTDIGFKVVPHPSYPNGPHQIDFNKEEFIAMSEANGDAVKRLLQNTQTLKTGSSANFQMTRGPDNVGALTEKTVTITVNWTGSTHTATFSAPGMSDQIVAINAADNLIIGPSNTPFSGISINYSGNTGTTESMSVEYVEGVLARFYTDLNGYVGTGAGNDGKITKALNQLESVKTSMAQQEDRANKTFLREMASVLEKLGKMAADLMMLQTIQTMFDSKLS